jgi:simple sugar transport system ATP-binding protein
VLAVQDLQARDDRGQVTLDGVSFTVHAGQVLGIAGVQGNGQTELAEVLTGLRRASQGSVHMLGRDVTNEPPREMITLGTAHVPEDRQRHGLVLQYPVADNLVLCTFDRAPFSRRSILDDPAIAANAAKLVGDYDVRTPSVHVLTGTLSGGNQQKVIVAREFSRPIKLLIANQPTRGLDVGSIEYIHARIIDKRDAGCAVLLISAELDEVLALSDRIAVIYRGKIVAVLDSAAARREVLGLLMAGIAPTSSSPSI